MELGLSESVWEVFCLRSLEMMGLLLEHFIPSTSFPFADLFPFNRQLVIGEREMSLPALKYWHSGAVVQGMGNFSVSMAAGIVIYIIFNHTVSCFTSQYLHKVQFNLNLCESLAFLSRITFVENLGWGETVPDSGCELERNPGVPL